MENTLTRDIPVVILTQAIESLPEPSSVGLVCQISFTDKYYMQFEAKYFFYPSKLEWVLTKLIDYK